MNVCLRDVLGRCGATTPRQPSFPLYAFTHGRTTGVQYQVCCLLCASLADNDTTAIKISDHRAIQYASLCCGCKKYPPPICCQTCPHKTASLKTFDIYAPAVPYRSFCAAESLRANHILHNPQDGLGIKLDTPLLQNQPPPATVIRTKAALSLLCDDLCKGRVFLRPIQTMDESIASASGFLKEAAHIGYSFVCR